ncbi:MAG: glycosyltransferase family 2 protein [Paludibacteraceae bacterium]
MKPTIICLTPVKNEAWILDRFLKSTSLWADYIIIADQMSTDGSRDIAKRYSKVILIDNPSETFNELERKRLLVNEARKIEGQRLFITLDADEMFSPEIFTSGEWEKILYLPKGTAINFQWSNFAPDGKNMWKGYFFPWGYMDDDFEDYDKGIPNTAIHCSRVPISERSPKYTVNTFSVIHFQYTDWDRMVHKHYYYQCLEVINNPMKSAVDIYRQYHHMDIVKKEEFLKIPQAWIESYREKEIDILKVNREENYWYDKEVLNLFEKYGINKFKKVCVWNVDWTKKIIHFGKLNSYKYKDPRNVIDKIYQWWMAYSQKRMNNSLMIRRIDRMIMKLYNY